MTPTQTNHALFLISPYTLGLIRHLQNFMHFRIMKNATFFMVDSSTSKNGWQTLNDPCVFSHPTHPGSLPRLRSPSLIETVSIITCRPKDSSVDPSISPRIPVSNLDYSVESRESQLKPIFVTGILGPRGGSSKSTKLGGL